MRKILVLFTMIVLVTANIGVLTTINARQETHPADAMWIEPAEIDLSNLPVGYKFNITVWVNSSIATFSWQFQINFNTTYFNALRAGYTAGTTSEFFQGLFTIPVEPQIDNDVGYVLYGETLIGAAQRKPGCGSLAWIEFEVISKPAQTETVITKLDFSADLTFLMDSTLSKVQVNTYGCEIKWIGILRDVGITDVTVTPSEVSVGETVRLDINVKNLGTESETFTLQIFYNETLLYEEDYSIESGASKVIFYYWNTSGVQPGVYTITAKVLLPEDANPENNVFTDVTLTIRAVKKPPVASFVYTPYSPIVGETVEFDASESYDPDGGEITEYCWDFGDGYTGIGKIVTHSYASEGTYYVTLTVIDDEEQSATFTRPISVVKQVLVGKIEITMEPWCTNGTYPEWKNITICNIGGGCITKIDITHPPGYVLGKVIAPPGWETNYNIETRLITLRTDDPSAGIAEGECKTFRILFTDGPKEQGEYVFSIMASDKMTGYSERKDVSQFIDTTLPQITIVTPVNETVIKMNGFWVNATASDEGPCPCCGIDRVELYINGEFWGIMNYDNKNDVYYMWIESLPYSETYYNIVAKAYDKAGNIARSKVTIFWVGAEAEIEIYNKVIYDNYGEKKAYGHVESEVYVKGVTGFTPNAEIEIYFEDDLIKRIRADKYGRFLTTITIPEVPRGTYTIKAVEVGCPGNQDSATVTVYPWMFNNGEGYVGDTFTVEGKGFAANVEVFIYYRDVAKCEIHYKWATEWWNETDYMSWKPVLNDVIVAKVYTNEKGSFTATFTIPESYGGLHPIYGREKVSGIRSGYPSDDLWPEGLNQCVTFHVKTNIWLTPTVGVTEQYITLHGTGLPIPRGYSLIINDEYVYCNRQWSIVLDFGPHKYWVWEHNYIMNNEVDMGWLLEVRFPIYYYNTCTCCNMVWNGTLCWADIDGNLHEGCPFLKVPNLMNGEYIVKLYFYDEEKLQDIYDYGDQETFTIVKDPLMVTVETGTLHFPGEIVTTIIKTNVDGRTADVSQLTIKLFHETEFVSTLDWTRMDKGLYYAKFECPTEPGTYFIIVSATKQYDSFVLYAEGTAEFTVNPTLDFSSLNATLREIKDGVAKIDSAIGPLEFNLSRIIKKIEVIDETMNEVVIETYLGNISGKIESIDGEIAKISTKVGEIKTNIENINGLKENISGYSSMQTVSVAFSIIAAFAAILVVAIILRRGYKK